MWNGCQKNMSFMILVSAIAHKAAALTVILILVLEIYSLIIRHYTILGMFYVYDYC